jgi:hypothetical protein
MPPRYYPGDANQKTRTFGSHWLPEERREPQWRRVESIEDLGPY